MSKTKTTDTTGSHTPTGSHAPSSSSPAPDSTLSDLGSDTASIKRGIPCIGEHTRTRVCRGVAWCGVVFFRAAS
jgi:hypothetical protein